MSLNLAILNVRGMRDPSKCSCFLGEPANFGVDVAAMQATNFTWAVDYWVLEDDFVVLSAYGCRISVGVSLLVGPSLNADVNLVFANDGGRLVVGEVAVKSFEFWVTAVYAPNIKAVRISFFDGWCRSAIIGNGQF